MAARRASRQGDRRDRKGSQDESTENLRAGNLQHGRSAHPPLGPGEVLVDIRHVGLCGSDLATFTGLNPWSACRAFPGTNLAS
jgi:NADPH:quinone reductase-like Zn-dependent oxidoreductase